MDSAKRRFRANCIVEVFFNDCQASNQCAQRGDRDDREVRDGKNIWKVPPRCLRLYHRCAPSPISAGQLRRAASPLFGCTSPADSHRFHRRRRRRRRGRHRRNRRTPPPPPDTTAADAAGDAEAYGLDANADADAERR